MGFAQTRRLLFLLPWAACVLLGCEKDLHTVMPIEQPPPRPRSEPLKVGDAFPEFAVEGWLNGPPTPPGPETRLRVTDVWAAWCPFCRQSAPGLSRIQEKFAPQGVQFVSVTTMSREGTQALSKQLQITWPSGFGLSDGSVAALHADSGMAGAGYEVAPVVYITGPDNRIRWLDDQGRFRHQEADAWERELDSAIQRLLREP